MMSNNIEILFHTSGGRQAARYVSGDAVYAEALEHGRWISLYWSASGQVQRENTTAGLPGLDSLHTPLQAFELEIDGQTLHNRWEWTGASQRPGERPGTSEAVVDLRHQLRPVMANHPRVYHHTPDIGLFSPAEWCALEYGMSDRSRGYAGIFKLSNGSGEYLLRLCGVDLGSEYEVTLDNSQQTFRISGRELALQGLPIQLDAALTSELVLYKAISLMQL
jgi:hypothetical protein